MIQKFTHSWLVSAVLGFGCSSSFMTGTSDNSGNSVTQSANEIESNSQTGSAIEGALPENDQPESTAEGASSAETTQNSRAKPIKPSDGSEDWGYVKPDIGDNGDLFFRTGDLHDAFELQGLFLAGTYPAEIKVKARLNPSLINSAEKSLHPPIEIRLENQIGGLLAESDFREPYRLNLISLDEAIASTTNVVLKAGSNPAQLIPNKLGDNILYFKRTQFAVWLVEGKSAAPIESMAVEKNNGSIFFRGGPSDGGYDQYLIVLYEAASLPDDVGCFNSAKVAQDFIDADDMPAGRIATLSFGSSYNPSASYLAVACAVIDGAITNISSIPVAVTGE